ncbi:MAG: heat shock protein transcriptional repressor HspR [Candidatus Methylomirabilia bacterium]
MRDKAKPLYTIGVAANMLKLHPQTLRLYERKELIRPSRTVGRTRMYSEEDVQEVARVIRLTRDLGVNLAGVEIILKMRRQMIAMQKQIEDLLAYVRDEPRPRTGGHREREAREALVLAASGQLKPLDLF